MSQSFYSDDDAEAILKLASRKSTGGAISKDRLIATAAELGITPEAVEEAEREMLLNRQELADREEFFARRKAKFFRKLGAGASTCALVICIDLFTTHRLTWSYWVLIPYVSGIANLAWETFNRSSDKYQRALRMWKAKKGSVGEFVEEDQRCERWYQMEPASATVSS